MGEVSLFIFFEQISYPSFFAVVVVANFRFTLTLTEFWFFQKEKKPEEAKKAEEEKVVKKEPTDDEKPTDGNKEGNKNEGAPPPPPQEIILGVYMHCEGCAKKVRRCLKGFDGNH